MPNSVPISTPTTPPSPLPHSRLARSHNRRFHVRFPGVDSEEHLLDYYSCALVADILLQGHLYITENYFAFYSNIFGRKTQILLPVSDVIKVTKERTAKIIPNAVGLYTVGGKHVFGSLLQRNTTYRLMHHVWLKSADPDTTEEEPTASEASEPGTSDEALPAVGPNPALLPSTSPARPDDLPVRRLSRRKSDLFPRISAKAVTRRHCQPTSSGMVVDEVTLSKCPWDCARSRTPATFTDCFTRIEDNVHTVANNSLLPKSTLILLAATLLLVLLFLMATILVYRVSFLYSKNSSDDGWSKPGHRLSRYLELLKQQQEAVEEEILRITTTLKNRLNDLGQVRQSIDQISAFTKQSSFHMRNDNIEKPTMNAHAPS
ncbi:protein Aster-B [Caerostris darwini]|uniref:Protein Aster-B n=1 Tax=Caerostris darwini TaxID=1538125 RepID=A0AAV4M452_9ARAC|nr:protein Aster-B [Caerostris darwini]